MRVTMVDEGPTVAIVWKTTPFSIQQPARMREHGLRRRSRVGWFAQSNRAGFRCLEVDSINFQWVQMV